METRIRIEGDCLGACSMSCARRWRGSMLHRKEAHREEPVQGTLHVVLIFCRQPRARIRCQYFARRRYRCGEVDLPVGMPMWRILTEERGAPGVTTT